MNIKKTGFVTAINNTLNNTARKEYAQLIDTLSKGLIKSIIGKNVAKALNLIENPPYPITDPESQVQTVYWGALGDHYHAPVTRIAKGDGYMPVPNSKVCLLIECKFDNDLDNKLERAKVLAQCVAYIKRILEDTAIERKPNVIFVGDVNECFALHVNFINKFIGMENVDWTIAPSKIAEKCPELVEAIANDNILNENIYVSNPQVDDFKDMCETINEIANNNVRLIAINKKTIKLAFEHFCLKVLGENKGLSANDKVGIFMSAIKYADDRVINRKTLTTKDYAPVKVQDTEKAKAYFNHFGVLDDDNRKQLETFYDFLVEDEARRRAGFFITPKFWVDMAHKMISEYMEKIGVNDWYNDCVVWDCCCGTKSLTRDYEFGNLFLSTLEENELKASESANTEAVETFAFDFLNDSLTKLHEALKTALKSGKKIVFLINPPYGQATSGNGNEHKAGVKNTETSLRMSTEFGKASNELFVQFLYRIDEIREEYHLAKDQLIVATFSNPTWMSGDSFVNWRKYWLSKFAFNSGMLFNASEFADCDNSWGISFSIWANHASRNKTDFAHNVYENNCGEAVMLGKHTLYNVDNTVVANKWAQGILDTKQVPSVSTTNGLNMIESNHKSNRGRSLHNALGYSYSAGNNVAKNAQSVALFSTSFSNAHGYSITEENFDRVCALFTARKCVESTWINHVDMYSAPNMDSELYPSFVKDSYVYSMFNPKSNQTSVKGEINGESYDFKNQFYPCSKRETYEMLGLNIPMNFKDETRFIKSKLTNLSNEAQAVLDCFKECVVATANVRKAYGEAHPELQVTRWDCGWRQLKDLFKEHCNEQFTKLREAYKVLETKLRPQVYELGFLKK